MATLRKEIETLARPQDVWAAVEDIGALHTRLVPGFVTATRLEPGARIVTFANGMTVREPIVSVEPRAMRLVWTAEGGLTSHYNAAVQVFAGSAGGVDRGPFAGRGRGEDRADDGGGDECYAEGAG